MGLKTKVRDAIYEESSWDLDFDVFEKDGTTPVTPSSVKLYVMLKNTADSPTYINDRDGITNTDGITIDTNSVSIHLDPDDNQIVGSDAFEDLRFEIHTILVEVQYNVGNDRDFFEWELKIPRKSRMAHLFLFSSNKYIIKRISISVKR